MDQILTIDSLEHDVLARVLAPPGEQSASIQQVCSFANYVSTCGLEWIGWRMRPSGHDTALLLILFLPGRTAIVMLPDPAETGMSRDDQQRLLAYGVDQLADRGLYYVQALVEPEACGRRRCIEACGFQHLTQLIYLQRRVSSPKVIAANFPDVVWLPYSEQRRGEFARMLMQTYEDSLDCPELTGLRPVDAVIDSHKAAGVFDPALWEIACVGGEQVGCVLLTTIAPRSLIEIVYMGVARRWRGRGVGRLLLHRALTLSRSVGVREVSVVVDARNAPARQLYEVVGFRPTTLREAYIRASESAWGIE